LLLTRPRSEDEPVAGGVRAVVEAGSGDAGRAIARRELGKLNSSRLATPAATTTNLFSAPLLGPADNRAIIATAKEQINHAKYVVLTRRPGRGSAPHPHTVLDEATPP
jgi:hypothetical protein